MRMLQRAPGAVACAMLCCRAKGTHDGSGAGAVCAVGLAGVWLFVWVVKALGSR